MPTRIAVGVHEYATGQPGKFNPAENLTRWPGITLTRPFITAPLDQADDLGALMIAACRPSWAAGLEPQVSFKIMPQQLIKGLWTARVRDSLARAREVAAGRPTTLIYWHEGSKEVGQLYTAAQYADAWQIIYGTAKEVWPEATVAYCETSYAWRPGDGRTKDPAPYKAIPADLWLDDVYLGNTWPATMRLVDHPGHNRWNEQLAAGRGNPWGFGELGRGPTKTDQTDRADLFVADAEYLLTTSCQRVTFWTTGGQERSPLWPLDARAETALRDQVIPLLAGPAVPDGYTATDDPGVLWSVITGCLVPVDGVAAHEEFIRRVLGAGGATREVRK